MVLFFSSRILRKVNPGVILLTVMPLGKYTVSFCVIGFESLQPRTTSFVSSSSGFVMRALTSISLICMEVLYQDLGMENRVTLEFHFSEVFLFKGIGDL